MIDPHMALATAAAAMAAAFVLVLRTLLRRRALHRKWLPQELRRAKLFNVERTIYIDKPYPIAARPDRVYRLPSGRLSPVEFKTRAHHTVWETDRAQLSLLAWMLRHQGHSTSPSGWVVTESLDGKTRKTHRVELWDDHQCHQIAMRHRDLIRRRARPQASPGPKCRSCGHKDVCTEATIAA